MQFCSLVILEFSIMKSAFSYLHCDSCSPFIACVVQLVSVPRTTTFLYLMNYSQLLPFAMCVRFKHFMGCHGRLCISAVFSSVQLTLSFQHNVHGTCRLTLVKNEYYRHIFTSGKCWPPSHSVTNSGFGL